MNRYKLILVALFITTSTFAGNDTLRTMSCLDFYRHILRYHPVVAQSNLFTANAQAEMRVSRGLLDPKLESAYGSKKLNGSSYYTSWNSVLKIPIWYGTDLKVGYEQQTGPSINPENQTSNAGLWYAGITVPLGQGLIIDERRSVIRQAQLLPAMAEAEQVKVVNVILLDATKAYWNWYAAYYRWTIYEQACTLADQRLQAVRQRVIHGDLPSIDTIEASIALQDRQIQRTQARLDLDKALLQASVFLWGENQIPLELTDRNIPMDQGAELETLAADSINNMVARAQINHPDLVKLKLKQEQLDIEHDYRSDRLKPKVYVDYNMLAKSPDDPFGPTSMYAENNYKVGVRFSYSLYTREERGKIAMVSIKQDQNSLEQQQREREIGNEVLAAYQGWLAYEQQVRLQNALVNNARALRDGEQQRFDAGESSFFLVNSRETALLIGQIKYYELQAKYATSKAELRYYAGERIAK